ncbi:MAG: hypothetical protein WCW25_04350 [Patescibacteria group bacterium]|jgi:hypothetical protein
MRKKALKCEVNIAVSIFKEGASFVAYSPVLDLSTSAGSLKKVKERFSEAVSLFFEELMEKGILEEALKDLGWKKVKSEMVPPKMISQGLEKINLPVCSSQYA